MSQTDFIPRRDADYDAFFRNILTVVAQNMEVWGHIPQADFEELGTVYGLWNDAFRATQVPHIPQLTAEKNRVRLVSERFLRGFINRFLRWEPVTDLQRDKMGIRNWDTIRTPQPAPTTVPEIEADSSVIRQLTLRMREHGATHWGRPAHVHGIELAWGIMENRPEHVSALHHTDSASSNPFVLDFEESERGKRVFYCARWLNNKMQHGPWSDIESAIVP
jgi:hypothetical protein